MNTDPGHIKNLSNEQRVGLNEFWALLITELSRNPNLSTCESNSSSLEKLPEGGFLSIINRASETSSWSFFGYSSTTTTSTETTSGKTGKRSSKLFGKSTSVVASVTDKPLELEWSTALETLFLFIGTDHPDTLILRFLRARKWDVIQVCYIHSL
jgi:hypothetical protein